MTDLIKKLNYKAQQAIGIFESPEEFAPHVTDFEKLGTIYTSINAANNFDFVLVFVKTEQAIAALSQELVPKLTDDAPFWFVYPKKTSKKYKAEIHRDHGWEPLGKLGFESVRMVAVDDDWSALRFRKADKIKVLKRDASWRLT
ncbi:hypothetical protein [uncultured Imperialibacter sp.]|uniref:hypothetical protein n=1 Tax=uncultured Imperialibacter sp. TaxID=1672639 RepID=UPI0030D958E4|tara:strand:+ start:3434 stop:3865 length:432 start_codon:yes stop_codon:yes gene_type:complete